MPKTPKSGAGLERNQVPLSAEITCRFRPKSGAGLLRFLQTLSSLNVLGTRGGCILGRDRRGDLTSIPAAGSPNARIAVYMHARKIGRAYCRLDFRTPRQIGHLYMHEIRPRRHTDEEIAAPVGDRHSDRVAIRVIEHKDDRVCKRPRTGNVRAANRCGGAFNNLSCDAGPVPATTTARGSRGGARSIWAQAVPLPIAARQNAVTSCPIP